MADSDDEDLKRAIALSLQQDNSSPPAGSDPSAVIDISSDDDDDDLDAPVHIKSSNRTTQKQARHTNLVDMSKDQQKGIVMNAEGSKKRLPPNSIKSEIVLDKFSKPLHPSLGSVLLGLDRKQMEAERLARAQQKKQHDEGLLSGSNGSRKRKVSISKTVPGDQEERLVKTKVWESSQPTPKDSKDQDPALQPDVVSRTKFPNAADPLVPNVMSFNQQKALQAPAVQYPDGVVKRTWVKGCPREDDIKIEEVFQKDDLELAVLSAFQYEPNWVADKLLDNTKIVWVIQAKDENEKQNLRQGAPRNYSFCFPSMEGQINCMHSKLQLLAHPTHLRVVVPSANLVPYDWGETGVMENTCFLIDLPRLPEGNTIDPGETSEFGKELLYFITAMGLSSKLVRSVSKFDFSRTSHIRFVHTIGGSHSGVDWKRTGYCGLGTAIRSLGLATEEALSVDFVTSSIGSLTERSIKQIYLAVQGDDGFTEYGWRYDKPSRGKGSTGTETEAERKVSDDIKGHFRVFFPTEETVKNSRGGTGAGGTICLQSKWFDSNTFPRHLLRDCKSRRQGMLMHNKMIFVQPGRSQQDGGKAWAYVGSANLSESAWGKLVKDRATKEPKLNCRSWECGVVLQVLPIGSRRAVNDSDNGSQGFPNMEIFRGHVPVPMVVPGESYGAKRPWFSWE